MQQYNKQELTISESSHSSILPNQHIEIMQSNIEIQSIFSELEPSHKEIIVRISRTSDSADTIYDNIVNNSLTSISDIQNYTSKIQLLLNNTDKTYLYGHKLKKVLGKNLNVKNSLNLFNTLMMLDNKLIKANEYISYSIKKLFTLFKNNIENNHNIDLKDLCQHMELKKSRKSMEI